MSISNRVLLIGQRVYVRGGSRSKETECDGMGTVYCDAVFCAVPRNAFTIPFFAFFSLSSFLPSLGAQCPPRRVVSTSSWRATFVSSLSFVGKREERKKNITIIHSPSRKTMWRPCSNPRSHVLTCSVPRRAVPYCLLYCYRCTSHCTVPLCSRIYYINLTEFVSNFLPTPSPSHRA